MQTTWTRMTRRHLLLAVVLATSARADDGPTPGRMVVTFVAFPEHGTAVIVQMPGGRTIVVDAGLGNDHYDAGRDAIGPLLDRMGVTELAAVVISHPHSDHYGGARWLIDHRVVRRFVDNGYEGRGQTDAYRAIRARARERGAEVIAAHAGDQFDDWDPAVKISILSPPPEFLLQDADPAKVSEHSVLNNNSLVVRIQHGENVFLLPGDAYGSEGSYLLRHSKPEELRARVLCAPHHGFNSTPGYAAVIRPEVVVASCLAHYENSPIASPGDQAAKVFEPVGATVYSTAKVGTVRIESDGRTIRVETERPAKMPVP